MTQCYVYNCSEKATVKETITRKSGKEIVVLCCEKHVCRDPLGLKIRLEKVEG
jgi:hypothetical protein